MRRPPPSGELDQRRWQRVKVGYNNAADLITAGYERELVKLLVLRITLCGLVDVFAVQAEKLLRRASF